MKNTIKIQCPAGIMMELRMDLGRFAELIKLQPATALFREGKLSLCVAALRCDIPCVHFLMQAMQFGACLLDNNEDDFARETA